MFHRFAGSRNLVAHNFCAQKISLLVITGLLGCLSFSSANAAPVEVPQSASPAQVEKRYPQQTTTPGQLQLSLPEPVETQQIPEKVREQLEKSKFVLKEVVVEGATVYQPEDLKFAYQDKVGQTISLLDAKLIAVSITELYHRNGYVLSQAIVPAQKVEDGVLKLRVVEGYIGNVSFEGDERSEGERRVLEGFVDKIKQERPADIKDMERYMLLMNDLPGANVRGLIRPSTTGVGSADLVLTVTHKTIDASVGYDNRGSKFLGPWEQTASVDANSILGMYDHTQVRLITADPFKELFSIQGEHDELLDSEGTRLGFLVSHTGTKPGSVPSSLDVTGYSDTYEAKISHPFIRLREQTLVGRFLLDVNNTSTDVFGGQGLAVDRLRTARIGANYNFLDSMRGSNTIDGQLSQGMNIFNATSSGVNRSNAFGDSAFTKTNFDLSRLQLLPGNFSLFAAATGQYSFEPLLTDEQFSLGGTEYGRAFDPSELLGDSGIAGKVELRYGERVDQYYINSYQLYTYYDVGQVWIRDAALGSISDPSLSSFGIGARANVTDYVTGSIEGSVPVSAPSGDQSSYRGDPRVFFTIAAHY